MIPIFQVEDAGLPPEAWAALCCKNSKDIWLCILKVLYIFILHPDKKS
jgi:hypothetical protein